MKTLSAAIRTTIVLAFTAGGPTARAGDATWNQTNDVTTTQPWESVVNWVPNTTYPNGIGETAVITQGLTNVSHTIGLNLATITVGRIVLGNGLGAISNRIYTLSGATTNTLLFQNTNGVPAVLELFAGGGTMTHALNATVLLGSDLLVTNAGPQSVTFGKNVDVNAHALTTAGTGTSFTVQFSADVTGTGLLTCAHSGVLNISSTVKSFAGPVLVKEGTLNMTGLASLRNATNLTIDGYYYFPGSGNGVNQAGGSVTMGNNTASANPGQQLPMPLMELNGGTLSDSGQKADGTWTNEFRADTVTVFRCNSGYGYVLVVGAGATAGTVLDVTTLQRSNNATLYMRGLTNTIQAHFLIGNINGYLAGAGGVAGQADMSIVPWICARNDTSSTATPDGFATYIPGSGLRALYASEYTNTLTAGPTYNVSYNSNVGLPTLTNDVTVNALRFGTSPVFISDLGTNRTLTIASGALFLSSAAQGIGKTGSGGAGILNFGAAEGIVWTYYNNTNTIGAVIAGSGGLTKSSAGALLLTGANSYTGATTVSGGALIVGSTNYPSRLGVGDVFVADGAQLAIGPLSTNAIASTATVRLSHFGDFFGLLQLGTNAVAQTLYLGRVIQPAGTYGSSAAGAQYTNDAYFAGAGMLTVLKGAPTTKGAGTMIRIR